MSGKRNTKGRDTHQQAATSRGFGNIFAGWSYPAVSSNAMKQHHRHQQRLGDSKSRAEDYAAQAAYIIPTDHDILSGRGVNIAQHPGNERFRALVKTRHDEDYCSDYSTSEKAAVAKGIIAHIKQLQPPGRFLRRQGGSKNSRGLEGPWEELSEQEAIKKTCQALRDCNRKDRTGYADNVKPPTDVARELHIRTRAGLSNKEIAERQAADQLQQMSKCSDDAVPQHPPPLTSSSSTLGTDSPSVLGTVSSSVSNESGWFEQPGMDIITSSVTSAAVENTGETVTMGCFQPSTVLRPDAAFGGVPAPPRNDMQQPQRQKQHMVDDSVVVAEAVTTAQQSSFFPVSLEGLQSSPEIAAIDGGYREFTNTADDTSTTDDDDLLRPRTTGGMFYEDPLQLSTACNMDGVSVHSNYLGPAERMEAQHAFPPSPFISGHEDDDSTRDHQLPGEFSELEEDDFEEE